jgi:hypothetical protein
VKGQINPEWVINALKWDVKQNTLSRGGLIAPHLTVSAVQPTNFQKMSVPLALQFWDTKTKAMILAWMRSPDAKRFKVTDADRQAVERVWTLVWEVSVGVGVSVSVSGALTPLRCGRQLVRDPGLQWVKVRQPPSHA